MVEQKIKVLLVDDHQLLRDGLRKMFNKQQDMEVIGEASTGQEAVEIAQAHDPDVIIMDVDMPEMDGIEATKKIASSMVQVKIIALTLHDKTRVKEKMYKAGASAFVTKGQSFDKLCATVREEVSLK